MVADLGRPRVCVRLLPRSEGQDDEGMVERRVNCRPRPHYLQLQAVGILRSFWWREFMHNVTRVSIICAPARTLPVAIAILPPYSLD